MISVLLKRLDLTFLAWLEHREWGVLVLAVLVTGVGGNESHPSVSVLCVSRRRYV